MRNFNESIKILHDIYLLNKIFKSLKILILIAGCFYITINGPYWGCSVSPLTVGTSLTWTKYDLYSDIKALGIDMTQGKVGEIYTQIFSFFRKIFVNIASLELRPVSNERSGNFTFYMGIHEFSNPSIFDKITLF